MRKLTKIFHDNARHDAARDLWHGIGRPLAAIAIALLVTFAIVCGESWAIRRAPLLTDGAIAHSADLVCVSEEYGAAGALPVAILH